MYEGPLNSRYFETYCFINCIYRQRIWETLSTHVHTASTGTLRAAHAHASDKCVIYVNFIYRIKRQCLISLFRLAMYIGGTLIKNYLLTYTHIHIMYVYVYVYMPMQCSMHIGIHIDISMRNISVIRDVATCQTVKTQTVEKSHIVVMCCPTAAPITPGPGCLGPALLPRWRRGGTIWGQQAIRRLTTKSREVSKPRDFML